MKDFQGQSIIITGGSSGIGLAIAKLFARLNAKIFILARNKDRLSEALVEIKSTGNISAYAVSVDISDKKACTKAITEIGTQHGIDLLINNAGISHCKYFDNITEAEFEAINKINYLGSLYCTKAAWPYLKAATCGRIVFVSSVAGYVGLIGFSSYVPTKFALSGFAESLRMEGKRFGIKVHMIYPPDTETPMLFQEMEDRPVETQALSANAKLAKPEFVAQKLLKGIQRDRFEIYCNFESRGIRLIRNLFPRLFFFLMDRIAQKGLKKEGK